MGLFGNANERALKKIRKIADKVVALEERFKVMSDDELRAMTALFKERYAGGESLDDLLPEAYATVREASARVLGMRHFYVQIMGGIVLHQGRIAEMKTGEGKTLVATLPAYLNAIRGEGVHIVTANEYLARRDAEWMGKVHRFLGLKVSVNLAVMGFEEKKEAYLADVTYTTASEVGFDYLRDNMAQTKEARVHRQRSYAIIDEVDSILIDEARTPLIISVPRMENPQNYVIANRFANSLHPEDVEISEKDRAVRLTESGVSRAESFFKIENLSDVEHLKLNHHINLAIRAKYVMKRDRDYIVRDRHVLIVDAFTGRVAVGRRFSEGLHQAIEAKEGLPVNMDNLAGGTITVQNYFRMYKKLSGMTGTAKTEEEEFRTIYGLDVVVLPTNKPVIRTDENDVVYEHEADKKQAIIEDITRTHKTGQPVLIGTSSVADSEALSKALNKQRIIHVVLNAKNHEREAEIVAQAGKVGAVTIATNMAGRGTDILLGGNPEFRAKMKMERERFSHSVIDKASAPYVTGNETEEEISARARFKELYEEYKRETDAEKAKVVELGGLRIIGTERNESRRIDNQLRGRSGRQGDPGSTVFYVSVEDTIIRRAMGDRTAMFSSLLFGDNSGGKPLSYGMMTKIVERAQKKIEGANFSFRKHVLSYDDVMNVQRDLIYSERNKVLEGLDIREEILDMIDNAAVDVVNEVIDFEKDPEEWDIELINKRLESRLLESGTNLVTEETVTSGNTDSLVGEITELARESYENRLREAEKIGFDFSVLERSVFIKALDNHWIAHIDDMEHLRKGITLRAYGQQDPLIAYKAESLELFENMQSAICRDTVVHCLKDVITARMVDENGEEVVRTIGLPVVPQAGAQRVAPSRAMRRSKAVRRGKKTVWKR